MSMIQKGLFFCPKWIPSLGKLPVQLVLSLTVELSSQTFYDILDPCWEFMIDSKVCGMGYFWSETLLLYWCFSVLILLGLAQFVLPFLGWLCPALWEWVILLLKMVWSFLKSSFLYTDIVYLSQVYPQLYCLKACFTSNKSVVTCYSTWTLLLCWLLV